MGRRTSIFTLWLAIGWVALTAPNAVAQGTFTNGGRHAGDVSPAGDADSWTFTAGAGSGIMIRVGAVGFTPRIRLFGPDNAPLGDVSAGNTLARDGVLTTQAPAAGTFTVLVSAAFAAQTGTYEVHLATAPESFVVPSGDQGGDLLNGAANPGVLEVGDLDLWRFDAVAGDSLMLRMGATNATPWLRLYGPSGDLVAESTSGNTLARDGFLALSATNAGPYTLVVSATYSGQQGPYAVHLARAPGEVVVSEGDEGGNLENGVATTGEMALGDLDLWQFPASAGDGLMLRVGATNLTPWLRLYGPAGELVDETTSGNTLARDGFLTVQATNSGPYTLVVSAAFSGQKGAYGVHLARSPGEFFVADGDEGGDMVNGAVHRGNIDLGDLDLYGLAAEAGDHLILRVGSTNFTPWLSLYGPGGEVVAATTSGNTLARDGQISLRVTNGGLHTLVLSAAYAGQRGPYQAHLAHTPADFIVPEGDEGGALVNGLVNAATLHLGDLDLWSFIGTPGDSNVLRVSSTGFTPHLRLYGPDGALVRETTSGNSLARSGSVSLNITNAGRYQLVVAATYAGQSGDYTLKESRVPPDLIVSGDLTLAEAGTLDLALSAENPDEPVKPLQFRLLAGPAGAAFNQAGATNATLTWATTEADGPSTNLVVATVTDVVNGREFTRTNTFNVVIEEVNQAPVLVGPPDATLDELTPLEISVSATDTDLPANALTFSLIDAPAGMTIDPASGAIAWTPTEAQGPSENRIGVVVTDDNPWAVNDRQLSVTNFFTVTVREINLPPLLTVPAPQVLDELTGLAVAAVATDADLPANPLSFALAAGPAGLTLDPATGAMVWNPTEAQGPSTNDVMVVVTDSNAVASNATLLSVTNTFQVVVREVNTPPQLTIPGDTTIAELAGLSLTAVAIDTDLPANPLTFGLAEAPGGMAIDTATGAIAWTPTEAQGPSTNRVSVVVSDSNPFATQASFSVTNSFLVIVTEANTAPTLEPIDDQSVHFGVPLTIATVGADVDLPANVLTYALDQAPEGMTIDANGVITWTPEQAQVGTYPVTVSLTDDGSPALQATAEFSVTVSGEGAQVAISILAGGLVQISSTGDVGAQYELESSANLVGWTKLVDFLMPATPYLYIDPASVTEPLRFYRLRLIQGR